MPRSGADGWSRRRCLAGLGAGAVAAATGAPARADAGPCPRLGRGINLHNLLNWPETQGEGSALRYVRPPFASPDYGMRDAELRALRAAGFDFVRLTVDPSIFIVSRDRERADLERRARAVVARLLEAGFDVVFDLHPVAVNPAYDPAVLVDEASPEVFSAYVDMVGRVAGMLEAFPPDRLVLEVFNEPPLASLAAARRWQAMLESLHARARASAPQRPIVLNGVQWDSAGGLMALDLRPFRTSNVLYTFHYYDPHAFTHQGVEGDTAWLGGLHWPARDDNVRAVLDRALARIDKDPGLAEAAGTQAREDTRNYLDQMLRSRPGPAQIAKDFGEVVTWAARQGIAPGRVLMGEFGCVVAAAGVPLGDDRLRWLQTVRSTCEKAGFGWAYWAYKGYGGMQLVTDRQGLDPATLGVLGLKAV